MARAAIGVDVGGTKLLGVAIDAGGTVLDERKVPTPSSPQGIVDAVADLAATWGSSLPVGLGIAGLVDRDGVLRVSPNLPGVERFPFRARLVDRLGVAVTVDNDATVATWGEFRVGAAKGAADAVFVGLGTGIGGGLVSGGVLQRGANGFAGEPGHMVVQPDGPPCPCGRRGCWERYASGSGLGAQARAAAEAGRAPRLLALAGGDPARIRGEHVAAAAVEGDPGAADILWEFAWWVALGIANLVAVLDPEVVVVGGGLAEMGDTLLAPVRARYQKLVLAPDHRPEVPIVAALLGEHAGAVGAALLASAAR